MSSAHKFVRMDGVIHLVLDSEHLVCHSATFDAAESERDETLRWRKTTSTTVTCGQCIAVIRLCMGVKTGGDSVSNLGKWKEERRFVVESGRYVHDYAEDLDWSEAIETEGKVFGRKEAIQEAKKLHELDIGDFRAMEYHVKTRILFRPPAR